MKNTAYWEKEFQTFTNTAEERKELIQEAFCCSGDYATQEAFCETADRYGYFNNVDFVLDMMNDELGGNCLCKTEANDFVCNYGLLGDIDFVFEHIFNCNFNSDNCYGHNYLFYMIQAFGLKNCIEKDPKKFLDALEGVYDGYLFGDLGYFFIKEPEAFFPDISEEMKKEYSELFKKIKASCDDDLEYVYKEAVKQHWNEFWAKVS